MDTEVIAGAQAESKHFLYCRQQCEPLKRRLYSLQMLYFFPSLPYFFLDKLISSKEAWVSTSHFGEPPPFILFFFALMRKAVPEGNQGYYFSLLLPGSNFLR